MADPETPRQRCYCVIAHPTTDTERQNVVDAITYARQVNDPDGLQLHLTRLTTASRCPANAGRP